MMIKKLFHTILLLIFLLIIFFAFKERLKNNRTYAVAQSIDHSVRVNAFIGKFRFTLFGYTSPKALVSLQGMSIYDQTYANDAGYFEFHNLFSPLVPREACLTAQDQLGRVTSPSCIPPFPNKYDISIGPVLLPPTVSLNNPSLKEYYQGDEIRLSGQSIPNTEIAFSTFVDEKRSIFSYLSSVLIKQVQAFTFPQLTAKTDNKGNFSLSLPSSHPEFFRLFAQTSYHKEQSPESVKLNINIYPLWIIIIQLFLLLWSIIKSRLLEIVVVVEILGILIFFIRRYLHPHVIAKNRSLVIRELYPLVEEETAIIRVQKHEIVSGSE